MAPVMWTLRTYFTRRMIEDKSYVINDLAVDAVLLQAAIQSCMFVVFVMQNEFILSDLIYGSITGLLFITGSICQTVSLKTGPGGPINALITTQIVYQTSLNALFFGQGISNFEYGGISFGILAAIIITLGD